MRSADRPTLSYDFGGVTLTSISAYETLDGRSRGDIDGGVAGVGPGFIPFDSDTQDSIDDLTQFTQEVRLASDAGAFNWQVGAYYFDSDLTVTHGGSVRLPAIDYPQPHQHIVGGVRPGGL